MGSPFVSSAMVRRAGTRRPGWVSRGMGWGRVLLVLVAAIMAFGANARPAGAAGTLEVSAGYGGNFVPGRSVPVRVGISADRLIRGVLRVQVNAPGREGVPVSVPVEVSGGTDKEYLVSVPTISGMDQAQVTASLGGDLSGEADLVFTGDTELVGLVPGVANRAPGALTLPADLGIAHFSQLDETDLATPGALEPLGTIVSGPDGLEPLDDQARSKILTWVDQGGRLVVDAVPGESGDHIGGLPDVWQPGAASRIRAGRGEVRLSAGAAAQGRWEAVVEPTPLVLPGELAASSSMFVSEGVADAIAHDGGLQVPTVGWLAGFLVVYVLLVGPILFVVLRRLHRPNWAWLAVPALAGMFAVTAFVVGNDLRSGSEASHGSVVHTGPAGARALSYVGLISRTGADGRAEFPEGWSASDLDSVLGDLGIGADPFGGGPGLELSPTRVSVGSDRTIGEVDLDPGGFGMVTGWGALDDDTAGLTVTAVAQPDGSVTGTVRNDTDVTLHDTLVMVGGRSWGWKEPLEPGQEVDWIIGRPLDGGGGGVDPMNGGPLESPWGDDIGSLDGQPRPGSDINYALWAEMTGRLVDPYPTGLVLAGAWTRAWTPPVDVGGAIHEGRTAFVAEAPVTTAPGAAPSAAVTRDLLRGSRATPIEDFGIDDAAAQRALGVPAGSVLRFVLPAGSGGAAAGLQARFAANVAGAEIWDGSRWVPLEVRTDDGQVVDPASVVDPNFDPWSTGERTAALPSQAVRDGVVYLRIVALDMGDPMFGAGLTTVGQETAS